MPRTLRAALRITRWFGRNSERDLRERVAAGVRISRRITAFLGECPFRNAHLPKVRDLQMAHPFEERHVSLDHGIQALVDICTITGNPREELWDESGMIELLLLVGAKVRLWARHPKHIAMNNHF